MSEINRKKKAIVETKIFIKIDIQKYQLKLQVNFSN